MLAKTLDRLTEDVQSIRQNGVAINFEVEEETEESSDSGSTISEAHSWP